MSEARILHCGATDYELTIWTAIGKSVIRCESAQAAQDFLEESFPDGIVVTWRI